jgi:hypothetical protein
MGPALQGPSKLKIWPQQVNVATPRRRLICFLSIDLLKPHDPPSANTHSSCLRDVGPPSRRLPGRHRRLLFPHSRNRQVPLCSFLFNLISTNTSPPASGLYYLSELVEEYTVLASRLLSRLIYAVIFIQILLAVFDRFPFFLSLLSIISHLVYASNLRRFPIVKLSDPLFLLSCILVILNHWLWFRHFSTPPTQGYSYDSGFGAGIDVPSFTEIASYFGLCVWLVPFSLFVSLSAGENVLPSMGSEYATGDHGAGVGGSQSAGLGGDKGIGAKRSGMAKAMVDGVREWVGDTGELMGFWRGEKTRRF